MNPAAVSRSLRRSAVAPASRCLYSSSATATYTPPASAWRPAPPRPARSAGDGDNLWGRRSSPRKAAKPSKNAVKAAMADPAIPQFTLEQLREIYSDELFVFRSDVAAMQISSAMTAYPELREVQVLRPGEIGNLVQQIHQYYRATRDSAGTSRYIETIFADLQAGKIPGHTHATMHIISCLKDMEEYSLANTYWEWFEKQDSTVTDARAYGAEIESLAFQGVPLSTCETLYAKALTLFLPSVTPEHAAATGEKVPLILLQGIMTARLFHGAWRAAYDAFDLCARLYPSQIPPRIYELFIYERPVREAYIVFLMACRAGTPPTAPVLTALMKEVWFRTRDLCGLLKLCYAYVGAGGRPRTQHLNVLIWGMLGSFASSKNAELQPTLNLIRTLIAAFARVGAKVTTETFNTVISIGARTKRRELIHSGLREMAAEKLPPTMATYRILLMALAEVGDYHELESTWKTLCTTHSVLKEPWTFADLKALAQAARLAGKEEWARQALEDLRLEIGYELHRKGMQALLVPQKDKKPDLLAFGGDGPEPKPQRGVDTEEELRRLTAIFASGQLSDFSTSPALGAPLFQLAKLPGSRDVPPEPFYDNDLRDLYWKLRPKMYSMVGEEEASRISTGFTVAQLRFENWKTINRLLYEARVADAEMERKMLKKVARESAGSLSKKDIAMMLEEVEGVKRGGAKEEQIATVLDEEEEAEGKKNEEPVRLAAMLGEAGEGVEAVKKEEFGYAKRAGLGALENAKQRLALENAKAQVDKIENMRKVGENGWRDMEMDVRQMLIGQ